MSVIKGCDIQGFVCFCFVYNEQVMNSETTKQLCLLFVCLDDAVTILFQILKRKLFDILLI